MVLPAVRQNGILLIYNKISKPLPKRQILDSSKLKKFADDNFEFEEKSGNSSKRVENVVGKGQIAHEV